MTLALLCQFTAQHISDVNTSETCWAVIWHNKASVIKLVYLYSNIKMMNGPIRIRFTVQIITVCGAETLYKLRIKDTYVQHPPQSTVLTFASFINPCIQRDLYQAFVSENRVEILS